MAALTWAVRCLHSALIVSYAVSCMPLKLTPLDKTIHASSGAILNVGLTAFVLAFVAYIGSYAVEALGELGEASSNVAERIQGDGSAPQPKSKEPVYDDAFESDLANLRAPVTKKKRIVSGMHVRQRVSTHEHVACQGAADTARMTLVALVTHDRRRRAGKVCALDEGH